MHLSPAVMHISNRDPYTGDQVSLIIIRNLKLKSCIFKLLHHYLISWTDPGVTIESPYENRTRFPADMSGVSLFADPESFGNTEPMSPFSQGQASGRPHAHMSAGLSAASAPVPGIAPVPAPAPAQTSSHVPALAPVHAQYPMAGQLRDAPGPTPQPQDTQHRQMQPASTQLPAAPQAISTAAVLSQIQSLVQHLNQHSGAGAHP